MSKIPEIFALAHKLEQELEITKGEQEDLRQSLEVAISEIKQWKDCATKLYHAVNYLKPNILDEQWGFFGEKEALLEYKNLMNL